jgi:hypothetical protein
MEKSRKMYKNKKTNDVVSERELKLIPKADRKNYIKFCK